MTRILVGLVTLGLLAPAARADSVRCRGAIAKDAAKYAQAAVKTLQGCRERVRAGRLPLSTDCGADAALTTGAAKLASGIAAQCCGPDRSCGTPDDEALASLGWDVGSCPDVVNAGCTNALAHPGDIATCLACVGRSAADELTALLYEPFAPAPSGTAAARCQATLGKESRRFVKTASAALQHCWDARNRGVHANPCPDPGDGKASGVLARAEALERERVCGACGGADGQCGGGDDVPVAGVSALEHCPTLQVPGGAACAAPIGSVADLVACVACLGQFTVACDDRAAVPGFAAYPAECNPPPGACSAGVECETSLDCPSGYSCQDNGGRTRYCVGDGCTSDGECGGGGVCRQYCTVAGCGPPQCQCPGFGCFGPDELCVDDGGLACRKVCTQDSDCVAPFGDVCVNPGFGFGVCIGSIPCQ